MSMSFLAPMAQAKVSQVAQPMQARRSPLPE
jgi:hypothetical protein